MTLCHFSDANPADNPNPPPELAHYFTNTTSMHNKFKKLNTKKSFGLDKIPNICMKHFSGKLILIYTIIFNNLLNHSYFPKDWKKAKVVSILKKNKPNDRPASYRPISLLPNISKVFETLINDHLVNFCNTNEIIPECQFGFRHQHSTIHALNRLTSDVNWAFNGNKSLGAILIDLEKAFDTVWLDGLLYKLIKLKFPYHLTKLVWSMISERSFITASGDNLAKIVYNIYNGLQQGTVNSPILFSIYTSDMLKIFELNLPEKPQAIAFADDLIVYLAHQWSSKIQEELQILFRKLEFYFKTWKMTVNIDKCETILFRLPLQNANSNVRKYYKSFKIESAHACEDRKIVPHRKQVKYLGVILDERLHYKAHISIQLKKALQAYMSLKRLFFSKQLQPEVKLICYQLLIRPIITYGCPIWYNISASLMEEIRIFERRCLRSCTNLYRAAESDYVKHVSNIKLYDTAKVPRIDNFMISLTRDHFAQASKLYQNSLIYGAFYPNSLYYQKALESGYIPPEAFIYLDNNGLIQDTDYLPFSQT